MEMVDVDGSSHLSADSQPKMAGLVCGLAATWQLSLHSSNELGELSQWPWSWGQHHKHCRWLLLLLFVVHGMVKWASAFGLSVNTDKSQFGKCAAYSAKVNWLYTTLGSPLALSLHSSNSYNMTSSIIPPPRRICNCRCLSVSNFVQKVVNGFSWNFQRRLAMNQCTND